MRCLNICFLVWGVLFCGFNFVICFFVVYVCGVWICGSCCAVYIFVVSMYSFVSLWCDGFLWCLIMLFPLCGEPFLGLPISFFVSCGVRVFRGVRSFGFPTCVVCSCGFKFFSLFLLWCNCFLCCAVMWLPLFGVRFVWLQVLSLFLGGVIVFCGV